MRDTIDIAREAGFTVGPSRDGPDDVWGVGKNLVRFESLIRADEREAFAKIQFESLLQAIRIEREACAKVADLVAREIDDTNSTATYIAAAIRDRGNT
jgi:hypothetical protein